MSADLPQRGGRSSQRSGETGRSGGSSRSPQPPPPPSGPPLGGPPPPRGGGGDAASRQRQSRQAARDATDRARREAGEARQRVPGRSADQPRDGGGLRERAREAVERGREAVGEVTERAQGAFEGAAGDEGRDGEPERRGRAEARGRTGEVGRGEIGTDRAMRTQRQRVRASGTDQTGRRDADPARALRASLQQPVALRRAVLLREILGPPVSMCDDDEDSPGLR